MLAAGDACETTRRGEHVTRANPMQFGLRYCNTGRYVDGGKAVELLQAAEEAGFESAWTVETHGGAGRSRFALSVLGGRAHGRWRVRFSVA